MQNGNSPCCSNKNLSVEFKCLKCLGNWQFVISPLYHPSQCCSPSGDVPAGWLASLLFNKILCILSVNPPLHIGLRVPPTHPTPLLCFSPKALVAKLPPDSTPPLWVRFLFFKLSGALSHCGIGSCFLMLTLQVSFIALFLFKRALDLDISSPNFFYALLYESTNTAFSMQCCMLSSMMGCCHPHHIWFYTIIWVFSSLPSSTLRCLQ